MLLIFFLIYDRDYDGNVYWKIVLYDWNIYVKFVVFDILVNLNF